MEILYPTAPPALFDVSPLASAGKLTKDERAVVTAVLERMRTLNGLIEAERPQHQQWHAEQAAEARRLMSENPTPATIHECQRTAGIALDRQRIFRAVHDDLNALADAEAAKLAPIASRLHAEALEAVKDASKFGLAEIEASGDPDALADFNRSHAATVDAFAAVGSGGFQEGRSAYGYLTQHGIVENIYA
jgi:hypothetical protein